ncbi:MAG: hypothetical protein KBA53_00490 [Thermoclostridium sp.]|nr:hypothetical protein [Thermoclostridium sp.]
MKRSLLGYKVSEVNAVLDALREENEALNAAIITLKTQVKNNAIEKSAKSILLEEELEQCKKKLIVLNQKIDLLELQNEEYLIKIEALTNENKSLMKQLADPHLSKFDD